MFDKIADEDDPYVAGMEGISSLCEDLGIDPLEDMRILVLLWKMGIKDKPAQINKEEVRALADCVGLIREFLPCGAYSRSIIMKIAFAGVFSILSLFFLFAVDQRVQPFAGRLSRQDEGPPPRPRHRLPRPFRLQGLLQVLLLLQPPGHPPYP